MEEFAFQACADHYARPTIRPLQSAAAESEHARSPKAGPAVRPSVAVAGFTAIIS